MTGRSDRAELARFLSAVGAGFTGLVGGVLALAVGHLVVSLLTR